MPTVIDLSSLGSAGFIIQGAAAYDWACSSVSSAGDINGDGFDDLIVGARFAQDDYAGEAYVIFGKAGGFGTIDLANLGAAGFIIYGEGAGDQAGTSVSSAGDVNGDGFDDLIVGAPFADEGDGSHAGQAYVIFGKAGGFAAIDLASLGPADGFAIQGDQTGDQAGFSVSGAGDINGDGFDDMIVGAPHGGDSPYVGGGDHGEAYVIFGKATGFSTVDLTTFNPADPGHDPAAGFMIFQNGASIHTGQSVGNAGDVNGDGYDDLIIGAPGGDAAYVLFGKASGFGRIDLPGLAPEDGFTIQGQGDIYAGFSVSSAGDVNGDGFDDLIVGAPFSAEGAAYVIFGKSGGFGTIQLSSLGAGGFIILGDAAFDAAGYSVSTAGDVNGDGFDDLIVGAPYGDDGGTVAGEAYVIFGKADGFGTIDLANLGEEGFIIQGDAAGDRAGLSVSSAGDVNGDGFDDIIIGAPYGDDGGGNAGEAYVIFGQAPTVAVTRIGSLAGQTIRGGAFGDTLDGREGADRLFGSAGNDILIGGAGADDLHGGSGADSFTYAAAGESTAANEDRIFDFETGADKIDLRALSITAIGWSQQSDAFGSYQAVTVGTSAGTMSLRVYGQLALGDFAVSTTVMGTPGPDNLSYTISSVSIFGLGDADQLSSGAGNDYLDGGAGTDTMNGGGGNDQYFVDDAGDTVTELAGEGYDVVYAAASYTLTAGSSVEVLATIDEAATTAINLTGNDLDNYVTGNAGNNLLDGGGGSDHLWGRGGDDAYYADGDDVVLEYDGQGYDVIYARTNFTLGVGVYAEVLATIDETATTAINLTGNALDNYITGNAGNNIIDGGGGSDILWGRGGDDSYFADGNDIVLEYAGQGYDVIYARADYTLVTGGFVEVLGTVDNFATTAINLTGNELDNYITGNAGSNTIDGGTGSDTLWGREGDDSYFAESNDVVLEYAGQGYDIIYARGNFTLGVGVSVEVVGTLNNFGTQDFALTGNELANYVSGNAGANTIDGGLGADNLQGRGGADTFVFGTALGNGNVDAILDYGDGADRILLDDAVFTGLGLGALSAAAFRTGASAQDSDDRIIYDSATGALYFDADGAGGTAQVQFAHLATAPSITAADFIVF